MIAADPRAAMLSDMAECAYRLGMAFGAEAERAQDIAAKLKWCEVFQRCFFALRVSTALELRLKQAPKEPRGAVSDRERLDEREDLRDRDPPERAERYTERDRDRETERASFPILVRALEGVAADAATLPGPPRPELLALRELLAKVKSQPQLGDRTPKYSGDLRARLAASGAATAPPHTRRPASNVGQVLAARRRATGPP